MAEINRAADRTGKKVMYTFNITGDIDELLRNHDLVYEAGGTCMKESFLWRHQGEASCGLRTVERAGGRLYHGRRNRSHHVCAGYADAPDNGGTDGYTGAYDGGDDRSRRCHVPTLRQRARR